MRSLRRPALALTAAAITVFVVALVLAARLATRPPTSAAPQATIFPSITPPATPTASPAPAPTATPTPAPSSTNTPTPTPAPTDTPPPPTPTPELIMLAPLPLPPSPSVVNRQSSVPSPGSGQAVSRPSASAASCPTTGAAFATLDSLGPYYKNNRLSDANPDLRLSLLGYAEVAEAPTLIDYNGATDPAAPRLSGLLASNRAGAIVRTFRRFDWLWDEGGPPPYGTRGGVNNDWPATVIALAAQPGEIVYTPPRPADIGNGFVALVLFAADDELTLAYHRQDGVADGYVIHLRSFCVDPNLVALYRAQITDGRRASGRFPALAAGQPLGSALASGLIVAVRDRGAFMDPRSRKDWW